MIEGLRAAMPEVTIDTDEGRVHESDVALVVVGYRAVDEGEYMLATDQASLELLPWPLSSKLAGRALRWFAKRYQTAGRVYGGDRAELTLRREDEELIARVAAANPRTVVVVIAGSAVIMEAWRTKVPAIALAWYPGMEGGHAIADVLLGRAEPAGRLPFVIPTSPWHLPHFDREARTIRYERLHGYRKLAVDAHEPAYPFGFGLGYTTFALSQLTVDPRSHTASCHVANTGGRRGRAVVQLYARLGAEPRQLVGFATCEVDAGAGAILSIPWRAASLSRRRNGRWIAPAGEVRFEAARWAGDPEAVRAIGEL